MDINSEKFKEMLTKAVLNDIKMRTGGYEAKCKVYANCLLEKDEVICSPWMWHKIVKLLGRDDS